VTGHRTALVAGIAGLALIALGFGLRRSTAGSGRATAHLATSSCGDPDGSPNKLVIVTYKSDGVSGACVFGGTIYQESMVGKAPKTVILMTLMGQLLPRIPLSGENGLKALHQLGVPRHVATRIMAEFNSPRDAGKSLQAIQLEMPKWAEAHSSLFHLR
jgi:hypothetical protein